MKTYRVEVKPSTSRGDKFYTPQGYMPCEDGVVYILTDKPDTIFTTFSPDRVLKVEYIGIGYIIEEKKDGGDKGKKGMGDSSGQSGSGKGTGKGK